MSGRQITAWTLGNINANTKLRVAVSDDLGLSSHFHVVPAGWRRTGTSPPHDRVTPEVAYALDELVRAHPVLGSAEVLKWLGYEEGR